MPETVSISYEIHADDSHSRGTVELPAWCSGDPKMAVALYFFGERTSVGFVTRADVVNEPLRNKFGQEVDEDGELLTIND